MAIKGGGLQAALAGSLRASSSGRPSPLRYASYPPSGSDISTHLGLMHYV